VAEEDLLVLILPKLEALEEQVAEELERPVQIKADRRQQPTQAAEVAEPLELIQFQPLDKVDLVVKALLF
tara:strand:- start:148 stop:357 length:210 start_codon:yes stop_codon:yes gene_type:complete